MTSLSLLSKICTSIYSLYHYIDYNCPRYFVTELLGTDLHRLLTSRPLEKQFIQYFLYQILVRFNFTFTPFTPNLCPAWTQIRTFCRGSPQRPGETFPSHQCSRTNRLPETKQHSRQWELWSQGLSHLLWVPWVGNLIFTRLDLRLWARPHSRSPDDRLRLHALLSSPGNYAYMAEIRRSRWHLEHRLYFCRNARGQTSFPRKGPYVIPFFMYSILKWPHLDVNQFSIITELLGTPPDDVIDTICSENVRSCLSDENLFWRLIFRLWDSSRVYQRENVFRSTRNWGPMIQMVNLIISSRPSVPDNQNSTRSSWKDARFWSTKTNRRDPVFRTCLRCSISRSNGRTCRRGKIRLEFQRCGFTSGYLESNDVQWDSGWVDNCSIGLELTGVVFFLDFHQVGDQVNGSASDSPVAAAPEHENGTVVTKWRMPTM